MERHAASQLRRVILASASERRRELLEQIGYEPQVIAANIDEQAIRDPDPSRLVELLAGSKLAAVRRRLDEPAAGVPVIAADTVVVLDDIVLEKPGSEREARKMITELAGRTHEVLTGVAVHLPDSGNTVIHHATTHVTFTTMAEWEIDWYLSTGEWRGVAGGYRIQESAARFISSIRGSYSNVVGLPLHLVYSILTGQWTGASA